MAFQQIDGPNSTPYFAEETTFRTASEYKWALLKLAKHYLQKIEDPELGGSDTDDARDFIFASLLLRVCGHVLDTKGRKSGFVRDDAQRSEPAWQ